MLHILGKHFYKYWLCNITFFILFAIITIYIFHNIFGSIYEYKFFIHTFSLICIKYISIFYYQFCKTIDSTYLEAFIIILNICQFIIIHPIILFNIYFYIYWFSYIYVMFIIEYKNNLECIKTCYFWYIFCWKTLFLARDNVI